MARQSLHIWIWSLCIHTGEVMTVGIHLDTAGGGRGESKGFWKKDGFCVVSEDSLWVASQPKMRKKLLGKKIYKIHQRGTAPQASFAQIQARLFMNLEWMLFCRWGGRPFAVSSSHPGNRWLGQNPETKTTTQVPAWGLGLRQSCVASSSVHFCFLWHCSSFSGLELMTFWQMMWPCEENYYSNLAATGFPRAEHISTSLPMSRHETSYRFLPGEMIFHFLIMEFNLSFFPSLIGSL